MKLSFLKKNLLSLLALALLLFSCSDDDETITTNSEPFVVAFESLSTNLNDIGTSFSIPVVYSRSAEQGGSFSFSISSVNAMYGIDFTTVPAASGNSATIPIAAGTSGTEIVFNKLNPNLDETTEIVLTITGIDYPSSQVQGNTTFTLTNGASLGRSFLPSIGGPNEGNQVYIDLSSETEKPVQRDSWDLSFYSGQEFRVGINGSIYMAAGELDATNIDAVTEAQVEGLKEMVAVGTFDPTNEAYIDHPSGDISRTAIDEISMTLSENKVYLLNLGFEVGTETPEPGSVAVAGDPRGWKKIRVLRSGDDYLLQYADLDQNTHQEVTITKDQNFNSVFFSFNTNQVTSVEPEAGKWDINFTVFTNIIEGAGSYGFSDGVLHNRNGGVTVYMVESSQFTYEDFSMANVNNSLFDADQRTIGSNWRDVFAGTVVDEVFFVLKDPNDNIYKMKFLSLSNEQGIRGNPSFVYKLLNQ